MENPIEATLARFNLSGNTVPDQLTGKGLPRLVLENYTFFKLRFHSGRTPVLLAEANRKLEVIQLEKQWQLLEKAAGMPVILVINRAGTRERERLIRRGVPFMVPGKFLHAPILGLAGEAPAAPKRYEEVLRREYLSPWAETILIKQLLDESVQSRSGSEIAAHFEVTSIVISQAVRELELHGLCDHIRNGKGKHIEFEARKDLWWKSLQVLRNPVAGTVTIGELPIEFVRAGETALARYSMLGEAKPEIFAVSKRDFLGYKRKGIIRLEMLEEEKHELQLWHRDPQKLARAGVVDQISVYLSLRGNADARVQQELARMMSEIGLEVPDESR